MLATLQQTGHGYTARFERHFKHSVTEVWAYLTENDKLAEWFDELRVHDLREGGALKFDMQDGTFEEMKILELKEQVVLEYTWAEDQVRFELYPEAEGCRLELIERITKLTSHTAKDLAGWHVCLDVIAALLDSIPFGSRKDVWTKWHEKYAQAVNELTKTVL